MSDLPPSGEPSLEHRLGLVLRGVQRMADGLGAVEQRLPELASAEGVKALTERVDEYRVRSRAEVAQVGELVTALAAAVDAVLRDQQALSEVVRNLPAPAPAAPQEAPDVERLAEAVRALRDDLAESHRQISEQTKTAVERVAGEQAERALRLSLAINDTGDRTLAAIEGMQQPDQERWVALDAELAQLRQTLDGRHVVVTEAIAALRQEVAERAEQRPPVDTTPDPPPPPAYDDTPVREAIASIKDDLARLQGELLTTTGQIRTDLGARLAEAGAGGGGADPGTLQGIYDRLGGIEWRMGERLDPLVERVAALESKLDGAGPGSDRALAESLASLEAGFEQLAQREDLRRGVDRVLGAVSSAEQAVSGEVKAVDARLGAIAEEVRTVRVLRDGLQALAESVDGVRQLAARSATSQQMGDVTKELTAVLAEIESARSQVLRVEQSPNPVAAEVVAVGTEVDDLGKRIDQLAQVIERQGTTKGSGEVAERLRSAGETARLLGNGVLEDLRARRGSKRR